MSSIIVYDSLTKLVKRGAILCSLESQYFVGPLVTHVEIVLCIFTLNYVNELAVRIVYNCDIVLVNISISVQILLSHLDMILKVSLSGRVMVL